LDYLAQASTAVGESPLRWRGRSTLSLIRGALSGALTWRYMDDYRNTAAALPYQQIDGFRVGSSSEFDLMVAYDFDKQAGHGEAGLLRGTKVMLNVSNVFDREPPLTADTAGFSQYNDPRQRFVTLRVRRQF